MWRAIFFEKWANPPPPCIRILTILVLLILSSLLALPTSVLANNSSDSESQKDAESAKRIRIVMDDAKEGLMHVDLVHNESFYSFYAVPAPGTVLPPDADNLVENPSPVIGKVVNVSTTAAPDADPSSSSQEEENKTFRREAKEEVESVTTSTNIDTSSRGVVRKQQSPSAHGNSLNQNQNRFISNGNGSFQETSPNESSMGFPTGVVIDVDTNNDNDTSAEEERNFNEEDYDALPGFKSPPGEDLLAGGSTTSNVSELECPCAQKKSNSMGTTTQSQVVETSTTSTTQSQATETSTTSAETSTETLTTATESSKNSTETLTTSTETSTTPTSTATAAARGIGNENEPGSFAWMNRFFPFQLANMLSDIVKQFGQNETAGQANINKSPFQQVYSSPLSQTPTGQMQLPFTPIISQQPVPSGFSSFPQYSSGIPGQMRIPQYPITPLQSSVPQYPFIPGQLNYPQYPITPGQSSIPQNPLIPGQLRFPQYPGIQGQPNFPQYPSIVGQPSFPQYPFLNGQSSLPQYPSLIGQSSLQQYPSLAGQSSLPQYPSFTGQSSLPQYPFLAGQSSLPQYPFLTGQSSLPQYPSLTGQSLFPQALAGQSSFPQYTSIPGQPRNLLSLPQNSLIPGQIRTPLQYPAIPGQFSLPQYPVIVRGSNTSQLPVIQGFNTSAQYQFVPEGLFNESNTTSQAPLAPVVSNASQLLALPVSNASQYSAIPISGQSANIIPQYQVVVNNSNVPNPPPRIPSVIPVLLPINPPPPTPSIIPVQLPPQPPPTPSVIPVQLPPQPSTYSIMGPPSTSSSKDVVSKATVLPSPSKSYEVVKTGWDEHHPEVLEIENVTCIVARAMKLKKIALRRHYGQNRTRCPAEIPCREFKSCSMWQAGFVGDDFTLSKVIYKAYLTDLFDVLPVPRVQQILTHFEKCHNATRVPARIAESTHECPALVKHYKYCLHSSQYMGLCKP